VGRCGSNESFGPARVGRERGLGSKKCTFNGSLNVKACEKLEETVDETTQLGLMEESPEAFYSRFFYSELQAAEQTMKYCCAEGISIHPKG
jgi:hypothetical protein